MITLTLSDGRQITDLKQNGNNYISDTKIDESIFDNNLETLIISDGENETVMHNAYFVQQVTYDDGKNWWLCFAEKTKEQLNAELMFFNCLIDKDEYERITGLTVGERMEKAREEAERNSPQYNIADLEAKLFYVQMMTDTLEE